MNMPGFTAEISLYGPSRYYHIAESQHLSKGQVVQLSSNGSQCPPWMKQTKTACPLFGAVGLWCRDYCGERQPISGWYPCGICFGGDF